jgi:quinol monooxygenase YgiN
MSKVAMLLRVTTKPGQRDELRKLWDTHLRARVEASNAQELYLVVEDAADPETLHLVEVYGDPDGVARNAQAPWFAEYMRAAGPLLAGPPTVASGRPVWAKGYAI